MQKFQKNFDFSFSTKKEPNSHEKFLLKKAEKYIQKIEKIPWISMIAICNSLSMFATNPESDIDLFIVTKPKMLWFVRFFVTLKFKILWVWRQKHNIKENFCLSFFVTENAMELEKIAIKDDIYLYFWIYYLKPIRIWDNCYDNFLQKNSWVKIDENQKKQNLEFAKNIWKSKKINFLYYFLDKIIKKFLEKKTIENYEKLWKPSGIIINENMLKFHNYDQREHYRDLILQWKKARKNF